MITTPRAPSLVVVYAQDIARVAEFYVRTLSRPVLEQDAGFILVGDAMVEVAIVQMPEALVAANPLESPPRLRENTPLRPSFLVDDLDRAVEAAAATGGRAKSLAAAWQWRGQLHLDGHDPEGNPVQFRARATEPRSEG